jgi:hypothetical protein
MIAVTVVEEEAGDRTIISMVPAKPVLRFVFQTFFVIIVKR